MAPCTWDWSPQGTTWTFIRRLARTVNSTMRRATTRPRQTPGCRGRLEAGLRTHDTQTGPACAWTLVDISHTYTFSSVQRDSGLPASQPAGDQRQEREKILGKGFPKGSRHVFYWTDHLNFPETVGELEYIYGRKRNSGSYMVQRSDFTWSTRKQHWTQAQKVVFTHFMTFSYVTSCFFHS